MDFMLWGAISMASLVAGLFFLRFWKDTGDRFFLFFAVSFLIEGVIAPRWGSPMIPPTDAHSSISFDFSRFY